jgi:4-amino-4-deoxy-L-arabinose transferase-like glycosyltransferase
MAAYLHRRDTLIFGLLALVVGVAMAALLRHPGYTDAYYYFNAGQRLAQGKGLTDAAIWTYMGAPAGLPIPSHLYWMPLESLVAAAGMAIAGPTFDAAQILSVPIYVGLGFVGFALSAMLGKSRRVAWMSGLLTLFSGFFMPYWTTTDTFAVYGLVGSLALLAMGLGRRAGTWHWFALSGALVGLAHLARADGLLLLGVLVIVAIWPGAYTVRQGIVAAILGMAAYTLVMTPWLVRNLTVAGSILPVGGMQTAWMRSYDEIFNYPPGSDLSGFLASGLNNILASRWEAFGQNLQTFIAVEGTVVLAPLMLIGLWRRRCEPLLSGFWAYALALHIVMTLVFPFPGFRGALFHSASALLPFWMALGVLGLDDVLAWATHHRRHWKLSSAQKFFGGALIVWAVAFSTFLFFAKIPGWNNAGPYFENIAAQVGPNAVVMINDPGAMYYFTGIPGVALPNSAPEVIPELAKRYGVNTLVLDLNSTVPMLDLYLGKNVPPFLTQIYADERMRIYRIMTTP